MTRSQDGTAEQPARPREESIPHPGPGIDGDAISKRANTAPNWANCPSTHCERSEECRGPNECTVQRTGRRALLPAFKAHCEAMFGGPLPSWPDDPFRWDERHGGLPYRALMADRFRDFMAGFDAACALSSAPQQPSESIETDGPHPITDHRRWLSRQLRDSKLSDDEAFGIVAYHPAIRAQQPSGGWRPIETAPRDDTEVLLLVDRVVHHGAWQGPSDGSIYARSKSVYNWFSYSAGSSLYDTHVTHWQSLPSPPVGEGSSISQSGSALYGAPSGSEPSAACEDCGKAAPAGPLCRACLEEYRERADEDWFFDMDGKP